MDILRIRVYPDLPKTARTFLGTTCGKYEIENFSKNEEFVYFGIKKNQENCLNCELHDTNNIELLINVDGLPLFKSSSKQLWPILCKVYDKLDRYKPFPVAIYCGDWKPSSLEFFFQKFINEINILQMSRITVDNRSFKVSIEAFICDRPARSLLKCMIGHGGYYSCERCTVKGVRFENRTIYPLIGEIEARTNISFRNQTNPYHHLNTSPLVRIQPEIDLVHQFVLDSMHLLYLGVMKKLLECWLKGSVNRGLKIDYRHRRRLCELLLKIKVPSEFQRNTRSLDNFSKFKSTELQFLLLYAGPIVFKNILSRVVYEHFLLLHAACRILCSNELALEKIRYAKFYLSAFVTIAPAIYTWSVLIGTIHNLTHIANDVEYMQYSLSKISSYPFENLLGKIKKLLRNGNNPLAQLCRRFNKMKSSMCEKPTLPIKIKILQVNKERSGRTIIKRLEYKEALLTTKPPNNAVLLTDNKVFQIHNMYQSSGNNINSIKMCGITLRKRKALYTYPCSSNSFQMWNVSARNGDFEIYDLKDVKKNGVYGFK
ncbi:uncharacterized protein [Chelonus insularis]|uniref:uncharacterized protein n=1 Tax=Chelonus insularis TaxID=460826 RepID=UPI00158EFB87|nr:uncharacterized protein LOC118071325 [Chelonus insularis]